MFTSSTKSGIRHFHVVLVQWRQRNVQKAWCTCRVFVLLFSLASSSSFLKLPINRPWIKFLISFHRSILPFAQSFLSSVLTSVVWGISQEKWLVLLCKLLKTYQFLQLLSEFSRAYWSRALVYYPNSGLLSKTLQWNHSPSACGSTWVLNILWCHF